MAVTTQKSDSISEVAGTIQADLVRSASSAVQFRRDALGRAGNFIGQVLGRWRKERNANKPLRETLTATSRANQTYRLQVKVLQDKLHRIKQEVWSDQDTESLRRVVDRIIRE